MSWARKLLGKLNIVVPDEFIIEDSVLPDFPSFKVSDKSIWHILNNNHKLMKLCGDKKPASQVGKLFEAQYQVDTVTSSEGYPSWSPITITIKRINK